MTAADLRIRDATGSDARSCREIYAPYVESTAITFETDVPSEAEMRERIAAAVATHGWLVLEDDGRVLGYASAHALKTRAAYRWSCESSIYVDPAHRGRGIGRALYGDLFTRLADAGYRRVFAGVALPNEASAGLHRSFGFELAGTFRRVGWKNGAWHDVAWYQRDLGAPDRPLDPPAELLSAS